MRALCAVHGGARLDYEVGLGFYAFLRFHVDTTKYRRWNMDPAVANQCPPIVQPRGISRRTDLARPQSAAPQRRRHPAPSSTTGSPATRPRPPHRGIRIATSRPCVAHVQHHIGPR